MIALAIYFLLSRANAASPPNVQCRFPDGPYTSAELSVTDDGNQGDGVTFEIRDEERVERVFKTITRRDAVARQLRRGRLQITMKGEKGRTVGSVSADAALLVLDREGDGRYVGRLAANGSVFEIVCD